MMASKAKKPEKTYLSERVLLLFFASTGFVFVLFSYLILVTIGREEYVLIFLFFLIYMLLIYLGYRWIYVPFQETNKAMRLFSEGYILKGIFDVRVPYSYEATLAFMKFRELIESGELINNSKKHAQYLALQNQINPHFLYNTLEGIRGEALIQGVESVAEMTEALATFFRYTISNVERLVTLEDELGNIENYFSIQRFRFGDRLELDIDFDTDSPEAVLKNRIPKLTLQPIVENSIFHGVERKIGNGKLKITLVMTTDRLIITISDNGVGMEEDKLIQLNRDLKTTTLEYMKDDYDKKGGIALVNVNNRIKLIFGDEYGIYVYSKKNAGTDVVVTLPKVTQ